MNIDQAFPSRFLKAEDIDEKTGALLTIDRVVMEWMDQDQTQEKPTIYFRDSVKGLVLNKTNATMMKELYGADTEAWVGRRIILRQDRVQYQGKLTPTIRIQYKRDTAGLEQTAMQPEPQLAQSAQPQQAGMTGGVDDDLPF